MKKILKLSLALSLMFSVYACKNRMAPTVANPSVPYNQPQSSALPNPQATSASNGLKPFSRPRTNPNLNPLPSASSSYSPSTSPTTFPTTVATATSVPSGDTGTTPDIKERATFNGVVYDRNGNKLNGVTVNAKAIDDGVNWVGETQQTVDGAYVFRNAPIGARLLITITKDGVSRSRSEVLKSNLQGDPTANVFDFSTIYSIDGTTLRVFLFDDKNQEVKDATIKVESLDPNFKYFQQKILTNVNYWVSSYNETLPINTQFKITVNANGKQKERIITTVGGLYYNEVKFGGTNDADKPFAIANVKEQELDPSINKFINTDFEKFSTFSVDTDTASYTLMRDSILRAGSLPSKDSVRLEEYVNYFDYNYPKPTEAKFSINTELAPSPFDKTGTKHIFRIGVQGQEISTKNRKDSILTFLIDTSGSMGDDNKLNNIKNSLKIMLKQLKPTDRVAIVEYNFTARTVLKHTLVRDESKIVQAIDSLKAISTTDIEKGLRMAFKEAQEAYDLIILIE
ncbi:MAG: von Willebrand factor type A domain-containing protein [Candidatus Sericytochromatia bacterium]